MIGVNREEDADAALKFIRKHGLSYQNFLDPKREFYSRFTPKYVPYNVVIGPDMKVLYSKAGFDPDGIGKAVEKAMAAATDEAARE